MSELNGKIALITGASAGLGREIAERLAMEGVSLILAARSKEKLETLAAEFTRDSVDAIAVPTDVGELDQLQNLVEQSLAKFGRIDILINNAGIEAFHPFETVPVEEITHTVNVNLTATMQLTRLVVPQMLKTGEGHIINMASTAGKFGTAYGSPYGATKAGMIAFSKALRNEYHKRGIKVSVICPGFTHDGGIYEEMKAKIGRGTPRLVGSTTSNAVCKAVLKALRKDRPEQILNFPAMRPVAVLQELCPRVGSWLVRKTSGKFLRRVAEANAAETASQNSKE